MIHPLNASQQLYSRGCTVHQWFMLVCNWVLIKSVSGAHVIVCFQDPPCVSLCVIGCYRCCECMSGLKERMDRLQCDCSLKNAVKSALIFFCSLYLKRQEFFLMIENYLWFWFTHKIQGLWEPLLTPVTFILCLYILYDTIVLTYVFKNVKKQQKKWICWLRKTVNVLAIAHVSRVRFTVLRAQVFTVVDFSLAILDITLWNMGMIDTVICSCVLSFAYFLLVYMCACHICAHICMCAVT